MGRRLRPARRFDELSVAPSVVEGEEHGVSACGTEVRRSPGKGGPGPASREKKQPLNFPLNRSIHRGSPSKLKYIKSEEVPAFPHRTQPFQLAAYAPLAQASLASAASATAFTPGSGTTKYLTVPGHAVAQALSALGATLDAEKSRLTSPVKLDRARPLVGSERRCVASPVRGPSLSEPGV